MTFQRVNGAPCHRPHGHHFPSAVSRSCQAPFAFAAGVSLYLSIPSATQGHDEKKSVGQKLASIDYLGAVLLVS